ncbi:MAG: lasso peptide biosynthesis B2 protein [Coxiellaceae bacterium]|nr:lasso peptide biosynthesis B2 protein [Coxiellaceae bacterium]
MKIVTFLHMPWQYKKMFFINITLLGVAKACVKLFAYKHIAFYFGKNCRMMVASTLISKTQIQQAALIARSIKLAARYTPWNSNCLPQAILAKFWCQHYQIPYFFFIGFAKSSTKPLGEEAHAWVTAGPIVICGGNSFNTFHVVLSYCSLFIS